MINYTMKVEALFLFLILLLGLVLCSFLGGNCNNYEGFTQNTNSKTGVSGGSNNNSNSSGSGIFSNMLSSNNNSSSDTNTNSNSKFGNIV